MKDIPTKLREDKLWREVSEIVQHIYIKINEIVDNFPDEKWATASKLRITANDSLFYASQAIGNVSLETSLYDWTNFRKNIFSLQSMYLFAAKQKFTELDPEVIVKIDKIILKIEAKIAESKKEVQNKNKEELEPWLEKYRIWQKLQK